MTERDIFLAALQQPDPAARAALLDRACGADRALRGAVEELLREQEQLGSFLEQPALAGAGTGPFAPSPGEELKTAAGEGAGTVIGPYKLVEVIGEGGMGTVWMAQQAAPVKRLVALKVIKPGMDTRQVLARFEAERQALALMDHPNIAKVHDAGATPAGRPYFVMELVKGVPITAYCDEQRLTPKERLELFIPVCQAIQHAHQKGVIHRDVKPSNVLVARYDGRPVPKVIDFGVAKAAGQPLTERTLVTGFGAVVGTLEYMSPEQAELNQLDIDTRSDIYSLGVLLYELLTGTTPLDRARRKEAPFAEVLRQIREEEPPRPSTRLAESKDTLPSVAASRGLGPKHLRGLVRGEPDWIAMKALEKDRNRRYESANGFAQDVQRYLADEPVLAGRPSAWYRLRKFVRRHRGPVLAAAAVIVALVGGMAATSWGLVRAERAWHAEAERAEGERQAREGEAEQRRLAEANEKRAVAQKQVAEVVRTFLQRDLLRQASAWEQADALLQPGGGGFEAKENPTIKELLERAAVELAPGRIEAKFPGQREVQAAILMTVGDTYQGIGEYGRAVEFLARASDAYREALGADHPHTLIALNNLGWAYNQSGQAGRAIELHEQVRDAQVRKLGADHPDTLTTLSNLAVAYLQSGQAGRAIELLEQVRDAQVRKLGANHPGTLMALNNLAVAYLDAEQPGRAIELFEQVRDARVRKLGADHPDTLTTLNNLAVAYLQAGQAGRAIELLEPVRDARVRKLGADHPHTLDTQSNLATAYRRSGQPGRAIGLLEPVRDALVRKLGADHPHTLTALNNLAVAYQQSGQAGRAIELLEPVRDAQVRKLGADHPETLTTQSNLAAAYLSARQLPRAIELYEQLRDGMVRKLGADHPYTLTNLNNLAAAYRAVGNWEQALPLFRQAAEGIERRKFQHQDARLIVGDLIAGYEQLRQFAEAEAWRRKWLAVVREQSGAESPAYAGELSALGWSLLMQEKWAGAEAALRECLALRELKEPAAWTTFNARSMLGEVLAGQTKYAEAEPLLLSGYQGMKEREVSIPQAYRGVRLAEAMKRLVRLYEATEDKEKAARWRKELEAASAAPGPRKEP
jgi:serine/threonine protein kinase/tetratricopeptide (TPR) repeat protein